MLSLEQIWRFLSQEIDKKMLLEKKISEWEKAQEALDPLPEKIMMPELALVNDSPGFAEDLVERLDTPGFV